MMANTTLVKLDCRQIHDWYSFHHVFAEIFGFPSFYGRNMNAWIDCMTDLDDAGTGMCTVSVQPGGLVVLQLEHVDAFAARCTERTTKHPARPSAATYLFRRFAAGERRHLPPDHKRKTLVVSSAQARQKGAAPSASAFASPQPL